MKSLGGRWIKLHTKVISRSSRLARRGLPVWCCGFCGIDYGTPVRPGLDWFNGFIELRVLRWLTRSKKPRWPTSYCIKKKLILRTVCYQLFVLESGDYSGGVERMDFTNFDCTVPWVFRRYYLYSSCYL